MANATTIKETLILQLEQKGANVDHFISLIDDYIWYFKQEKDMQKDIKKRGRTYIATSAAGKEYEKDNPSVKNSVLYNKQKLAILKELGLTTNDFKINNEDEEL